MRPLECDDSRDNNAVGRVGGGNQDILLQKSSTTQHTTILSIGIRGRGRGRGRDRDRDRDRSGSGSGSGLGLVRVRVASTYFV
jgi:hypothetical protein